MLGLDAKAKFNMCDEDINKMAKLSTVADWAQQSGMDTGWCFLIFLINIYIYYFEMISMHFIILID